MLTAEGDFRDFMDIITHFKPKKSTYFHYKTLVPDKIYRYKYKEKS